MEANEDFKDPGRLTNIVVWMLCAQVAVTIISIAFGAMEYQFLDNVRNGIYTNAPEQAERDGATSDTRQQVIGLVAVIVFVVNSICILIWIYRANYNARQLGAQGMRFSPGWAVGWYFIPILCLWKPYQSMKEVWRTSRDAMDWTAQPGSPILRWWWALWLLHSIVGWQVFRVSIRLTLDADMERYMSANLLYLSSDILLIALCVVFLVLIRRIYTGQISQFRGKGLGGLPGVRG